MRQYKSFEEFWPYYLSQHQHPICRAMHFAGSTAALGLLGWALLTGRKTWLWAVPLVGYGPAWFGHFVFEKNRPATFKNPLFSLYGDLRMLRDAGRISLQRIRIKFLKM